MTESAAAGDVDRLRLQLSQARNELASARTLQETLAEDLAAERVSAERTAKRQDALTRSVVDHLESIDTAAAAPSRSLLSRVARRLGVGRSKAEHARQIDQIRNARLFDAPWYVARYPDVVGRGMSPARHYLEVGAAAGYDASTRFRTAAYVSRHPELRTSGENPLLHRMRTRRAPQRG